MIRAIDGFAGPGGWDLAATALGIDVLGIEWDDAAVATREAAGLRTIQADVSALDPGDFGPVNLAIFSPPCPTFSSAGNGGGRHLTEIITRCLHEIAVGNDTRAERREEAFWTLSPIYRERELDKAAEKFREPDLGKASARARRDADMSLLVVEPLRWAATLEPRWIALEQVPEVLPIWAEMAQILGTLGYSTDTGILTAEQFAVPQTRRRAILVADREGEARLPRPTHQRYLKPPKEKETPAGLFEAPRVERKIHPEDRDLLPWISMAEALGWTDAAIVNTRGERTTPGGNEFSADQPSWSLTEKTRSWVVETHQNTERADGGRYQRSVDDPSPTIVGRSDLWKYRNGNQANACERTADEPAPTVHFGYNLNLVEWVPKEEIAACGCFLGVVDHDGFCACCHAHVDDPDGLYAIQGDGTHGHRDCPANRSTNWVYDRRNQQGPPGKRVPVPSVPSSEPAPTLTAAGLATGRDVWRSEPREWGGDGPQPDEAPATTVAGDPRLSARSHHNEGEQNSHAIRVELWEAAVLQSFSPDYPWQGSRTACFTQVGNAIPPLLAYAILSSLIGAEVDLEHLRDRQGEGSFSG